MSRWGRVLFASFVLATSLVVAGHAPGAWACSCVPSDDEAHFERAYAVFVGTVSDVKPPENDDQNSYDPATYTFDVSRVDKGKVSDPQTVKAVRQGNLCGYVFEVGRKYQVYTNLQDGEQWTSLCSGSRDLGVNAAYVPKPKTTQSPKPKVTSKPSSPAPSVSPSASVVSTPSPSPTRSTIAAPTIDSKPVSGSGRARGPILIGGLVLAAVVLLGARRLVKP